MSLPLPDVRPARPVEPRRCACGQPATLSMTFPAQGVAYATVSRLGVICGDCAARDLRECGGTLQARMGS